MSRRPTSRGPATKALAGITDQRLVVLIAAGIALALVVLFLRHPLPPLFDWPSHMARHYLESLALSGRPLPDFYAVEYAIMPNLGGDLLAPWLAMLVGPWAASTAFLILSVGLVWSGAAAFIVQYAGRTTSAYMAALAISLLLLSPSLFLGLMNSYSGLGVGLWAGVAFIHAAQKGITIARLAVVTVLVAVTYLWHLTAFGIFAVLAGSYGLDRLIHRGRNTVVETIKELLPLGLTVVPVAAMMLWVTFGPGTRTLSGAFEWHLVEKVTNFLELFQAYATWLDGVIMIAWLAIVACLFAAPLRERMRLDYMGIAALAFFALTFLLPTNIGLTYFIDKRTILPGVICVAALLATLAPGRFHRIALVAFAMLMLFRIGYIDRAWTSQAQGARDLVKHFETQPRGARILVANTFYGWRRSHEVHVPSWLVISAGAYVSNMWAIPGQQPLRHVTPSRGLVPSHFLTDPAVLLTHTSVIEQHFDYVWVNSPTVTVAIPPGWTQVLTTRESTLWRVR